METKQLDLEGIRVRVEARKSWRHHNECRADLAALIAEVEGLRAENREQYIEERKKGYGLEQENERLEGELTKTIDHIRGLSRQLEIAQTEVLKMRGALQ